MAELKSNSQEKDSKSFGEKRYAIDIVKMSKHFARSRHTRGGYTTIKSLFTLSGSKKKSDLVAKGEFDDKELFALDQLTLRVPKGSAVGIVGRNGSGKSTLLKLISGIYKPNAGTISVEGRVAALIELGAGFHPDFSGRENVYLAGAMFGLSRKEVDERFNQIVEFAELERVIDEPVRTYSSGMFMRLGFSLAVHTNPDILIIDEVLAVGDASFVVKCEDRLAELRRQGKTLLLVTHDLDAVLRWCDEAVWLDKGVVKDRGEPRRVLDAYRTFVERGEEVKILHINEELAAQGKELPVVDESKEAHTLLDADLAHERWGSREVEVLGVELRSADGATHGVFQTEDSLEVIITLKRNEPIESLVCGIAIHRTDGLLVLGTNTEIEGVEIPLFDNQCHISLLLKRVGLINGSFTLDVAVHAKDGYPFDYHRRLGRFAVRGERSRLGVAALPLEWKV
jgi:lipopolysaccharide transport system ATP-binding protein